MLMGEVYIHAEFLERFEFPRLASSLEHRIVRLAKEIFVEGVEIEFILEDGSLIERTKVIGKRLAIAITVVAGYHEFRESVIYIYDDAQKFGRLVIEEFYQITETSPSNIIYKRWVPSDINRLRRIVENVDRSQGTRRLDRQEQIDKIVADIAALSRSNQDENESVQHILDLIRREKVPELPKSIEEIAEINEREERRGRPAFSDKMPSQSRGWHPKRRYAKTISI
jgi:hypothetical protein